MMFRSKGPRRMVFVGGTSEPGGLHIHTAEIAQACAALGCDVSIICPSVNHYEGLITHPGIDVRLVSPPGGTDPSGWFWHWRKLQLGSPRPDLIFCRGHFAESSLGELAAARAVARRIYTIDHRPWEGSWDRSVSKQIYGRESASLNRRSIMVSEEIATSAVTEFRMPRRKISVCLNWVHPQFQVPTETQRQAARAALGIEPAAVLVGYVGRLAPEKRVDMLLRAFRALAAKAPQELQLHIVGDGWKREELTRLSGELGIADRVHFRGWTTRPWEFLAACDVSVLPSLVEGFPLALMEAMASGCACLAHPMSSTERLIENGKSGVLADLSDPESFAAALAQLVTTTAQDRRRLGREAASRVEAEFSRKRRLPDLLSALDFVKPLLPDAVPRLLSFNVNC